MLLQVLFQTPFVVIDHMESLGRSCPYGRPKLGGSYYCYFQSLSAPWRWWTEGDLPSGDGVLLACGGGHASGSHWSFNVHACSTFRDGCKVRPVEAGHPLHQLGHRWARLVGLASCLPSPFQYVFLLLLFPLTNHHLHFCTLVTLKWNTCVKRALLSMLLLILPIRLNRSMLTTLMALLGSALLAAIQMSQATLSLKAHRWWVLIHSCSFSFPFLHLNTYSNNLSFKI